MLTSLCLQLAHSKVFFGKKINSLSFKEEAQSAEVPFPQVLLQSFLVLENRNTRQQQETGIFSNRYVGFPGMSVVKNPPCQCRNHRRHEFNPWVWKILWRRKWQPTPVLLTKKPHGQKSLGGLLHMGSQRVKHDWATEHSSTLTGKKCFIPK